MCPPTKRCWTILFTKSLGFAELTIHSDISCKWPDATGSTFKGNRGHLRDAICRDRSSESGSEYYIPVADNLLNLLLISIPHTTGELCVSRS